MYKEKRMKKDREMLRVYEELLVADLLADKYACMANAMQVELNEEVDALVLFPPHGKKGDEVIRGMRPREWEKFPINEISEDISEMNFRFPIYPLSKVFGVLIKKDGCHGWCRGVLLLGRSNKGLEKARKVVLALFKLTELK